MKLARRILRAPALREVVSEELAPGAADTLPDDVLEAYVRERAKTVYHPSGTCRMGSDGMAVVDARMRVHGVAKLRVCDASVMPSLISGNTNAPTVMLAERCADFALSGN